jgi:biopolymer transport protein ExbD
VTSTDEAGRSPGDPGYAGASRNGECRIYFNNITPVTSEELYDQAFERLDVIVQRAGGPEAIMADPEKIPQVHIRGDVNAPWQCVAGAIYNVQAAGYPTVGFISNPVEPGI